MGAGGGGGGGGVPVPSPAARPLADAAGARRCSWPTSHLHGNCSFRCPSRTKPCLCLCLCTADGDREGDNGGEAAPGPPPHPFPGYRGPDPAADPQPRPRYLRLRLLHLVLRLHQLLVDLLQPRCTDLGGQSGRQGGLGPPWSPPGTPKGRHGAGREPGAGGKGAKVGGMGLGIRTHRAGAWGSGPGRMGPVHSCTALGAGMQGFEGDRVGWAGLGGVK